MAPALSRTDRLSAAKVRGDTIVGAAGRIGDGTRTGCKTACLHVQNGTPSKCEFRTLGKLGSIVSAG